MSYIFEWGFEQFRNLENYNRGRQIPSRFINQFMPLLLETMNYVDNQRKKLLTPLNFIYIYIYIYIYGALYEPKKARKIVFEPPNRFFWTFSNTAKCYMDVKGRQQLFPLPIVPVDNVRVQKSFVQSLRGWECDEGECSIINCFR